MRTRRFLLLIALCINAVNYAPGGDVGRLNDAIEKEDMSGIVETLEKHPELLEDGAVNTAVWHLAFSHSPDFETADQLKACGFRIGYRDSDGNTVLHRIARWANANDELSMVYLLKNGADPNARNNSGDTPLHLVARTGSSVSAAMLLLSAGGDPRLKNVAGRDVLEIAVDQRNARILPALFASAPWEERELAGYLHELTSPFDSGNSLLSDDPDDQALSTAQAIVDRRGNQSVFSKIALNCLNPTQAAEVSEYESIDPDGYHALHWATYFGRMELIEAMLAQDADPNVAAPNGATALHVATITGQAETAKRLIASGAAVDVYTASGLGDLHSLRKMLTATPGLLRAPGPYGRLPLHWAAAAGSLDTARLLLEFGADVDQKSVKLELTPLHVAAREGRSLMAVLLMRNGADVHARDRSGGTALHHACFKRHEEMITALLAGGADPDLQLGEGSGEFAGASALHAAITYQLESSVARMIIAGADVNILDGRGRTPLDHSRNRWAIAYTLVLAGAQPGPPGARTNVWHAPVPQLLKDLIQLNEKSDTIRQRNRN